MNDRGPRGRLFRKYFVVILLLVGGVLLLSSAIDIYFSYQETKAALVRIEREQAKAAAAGIERFIQDIERQLRWTTQAAFDDPAAAQEQREIDYLRLLRNVPAITEISHLDASGIERLRLSRVSLDVIGSQEDYSQAPKFLSARAGKTYFSPVYFRNESEPYMTVAVPAGEHDFGITVAEINLKAIWDVVSRIRIGKAGSAYVVDSLGRLVAHPDISLVLQKRDLSTLPQIRSARGSNPVEGAEGVGIIANGLQGGQFLTAYAQIETLGWLVFVEQPLGEAFAPLQASIARSVILFALALVLSVLASVFLARRMVAPIRALQAGAAKIGAGDLGHRILVRTGDELQVLGDEFNRTAARLQESYASLEEKIEARTSELRKALKEVRALSEISQAVSSTLDLTTVLSTIVDHAIQLSGSHGGIVYEFDETTRTFHARATHRISVEHLEAVRAAPIRLGEGAIGRAGVIREPVEVTDIADEKHIVAPQTRSILTREGIHSLLAVPLVWDERLLGGLVILRRETGSFSAEVVATLQTFATQSVLAIQNARLFRETKRALEQQTATSEILRVISQSQTDAQPVFETIAAATMKLCRVNLANVFTFDGDLIHLAAFASVDVHPDYSAAIRRNFPRPPSRDTAVTRAVLTGDVVVIPDVLEDPEYAITAQTLAGGLRSVLAVPLIREGSPIGAIAVGNAEPGPFPDTQIALLKTFADQAVIAIENVRLFKELEARTEALTRSVGQLTALGEVGQAVSSTLELETVLKTIVSRAVHLTGLDGGSIYEYDERAEEFRLQAAENMPDDVAEDIRKAPTRKGDGALGRTAITLEPTQVPDTLDDSYQSVRKELLIRAGYRALLAVPLLREEHLLGGLLVNRNEPGEFAPEVVVLLKTFATQSALAIQNARLFREIAEKGRQLEAASRHKSDFLASMSHELRTPLNAILGFNEMILGEIYGEVPASMKVPLEDIQTSGKHLLRLINNVLDLAKIEAGRMELALTDYSVHDTVESVRTTLRPLAAEKRLEFVATVASDIPLAYGDSGRITQCLMNLAGNSLKFTKAGKVEISVESRGDLLIYKVKDTGIGIPPDKLETVFAEFKQTDATVASEYGGTGLGLSISRKFIEMHGGRIWVESELGMGSTFTFEIPLRISTGVPA